ncbi:cyclic pyranopterin monophosphate synthase MoaC [Roseisolibacter sp. H3M3-2]|uniref:cyclic pyranopterin monophosphate synthase MoaC n=1 Tax=Roseisolibacter sp. H3M3-2 TaxID=3031323 RepID=UPI0023DA7EC9|nr:cyclic pyranopterin monophosphate synthase MoaC [Roseisolibacter sp. H3M3-2]MDF1502092.1 cyclic pyranopterin monophosphate synthase MoaC [Roseisolibacter sp. H3M3-2]
MADGPQHLTHVGDDGSARMVDVGDKPESDRSARVEGVIRMAAATLTLIRENAIAKGDVLGVARLAGIMAAKRTAELIPLCHPLPLTHVDVDLAPDATLPGVRVTATARTRGRTGVEMEALTAATVALLTVYDMAKAADRGMILEGVRLVEKTGGASGPWRA